MRGASAQAPRACRDAHSGTTLRTSEARDGANLTGAKTRAWLAGLSPQATEGGVCRSGYNPTCCVYRVLRNEPRRTCERSDEWRAEARRGVIAEVPISL